MFCLRKKKAFKKMTTFTVPMNLNYSHDFLGQGFFYTLIIWMWKKKPFHAFNLHVSVANYKECLYICRYTYILLYLNIWNVGSKSSYSPFFTSFCHFIHFIFILNAKILFYSAYYLLEFTFCWVFQIQNHKALKQKIMMLTDPCSIASMA